MGSWSLAIAALLTVFIGAVHSWLGERLLIGPLLDPKMRVGMLAKSRFARITIRFGWHITTIAWLGIAAILYVLSRNAIDENDRLILLIIAITFIATSGAILFASRGRHLAWVVFLIIASLTY